MRLDWLAVGRFIAILLLTLLFAWVVRQFLFGGEVGDLDVVVAIAVATVLTGRVTLPRVPEA